MSTSLHLWVPTKPYSAIDAMNRACAATGSVRTAMSCAHSDFNGHYINLRFNDYRQYWVADYTWGERVVLARGAFRSVLEATLRAFADMGRGACLHLWIPEDKLPDVAPILAEFPLVQPWSKEAEDAHNATWRTWKHDAVGDVLSLERWNPSIRRAWLESETREQFEAACLARPR